MTMFVYLNEDFMAVKLERARQRGYRQTARQRWHRFTDAFPESGGRMGNLMNTVRAIYAIGIAATLESDYAVMQETAECIQLLSRKWNLRWSVHKQVDNN